MKHHYPLHTRLRQVLPALLCACFAGALSAAPIKVTTWQQLLDVAGTATQNTEIVLEADITAPDEVLPIGKEVGYSVDPATIVDSIVLDLAGRTLSVKSLNPRLLRHLSIKSTGTKGNLRCGIDSDRGDRQSRLSLITVKDINWNVLESGRFWNTTVKIQTNNCVLNHDENESIDFSDFNWYLYNTILNTKYFVCRSFVMKDMQLPELILDDIYYAIRDSLVIENCIFKKLKAQSKIIRIKDCTADEIIINASSIADINDCNNIKKMDIGSSDSMNISNCSMDSCHISSYKMTLKGVETQKYGHISLYYNNNATGATIESEISSCKLNNGQIEVSNGANLTLIDTQVEGRKKDAYEELFGNKITGQALIVDQNSTVNVRGAKSLLTSDGVTVNNNGTIHFEEGKLTTSNYAKWVLRGEGTQDFAPGFVLDGVIGNFSGFYVFPTINQLYDYDGDGVLERCDNQYGHNFVFSRLTNRGQLPDAITGKLEQVKYNYNNKFLRGNFITDMDGDGNTDFIYHTPNYPDCIYIYIYSYDNTTHNLVLKHKLPIKETDYVFLCDINADGRKDLLLSKTEAYIQLADGTFVLKNFDARTEKEWDAQKDAYTEWADAFTSGTGGGLVSSNGIPSLQDGWMIGGSAFGADPREGVLSDLTNLDFNKDGRPDLFYYSGRNDKEAHLMIRRPKEDTYTLLQLSGDVYARDLTGDGITDYVQFDSENKVVSTLIYQKEGSFKNTELIKSLALTGLQTLDFDRDGDIDLLLCFDNEKEDSYAVFVYAENDGNGNFTLHENFFKEKMTFAGCADVDNCGHYEVIVNTTVPDPDANYGERKEVHILKEQNFSLTHTETIPTHIMEEAGGVMDLDREGYYALVKKAYRDDYFEDQEGITYPFLNCTPNKVPRQMAAPKGIYDAQNHLLKVYWEPGTDAESTTPELSYALKIGTTSGGEDILCSDALPSGKRRNLREGNAGYELSKIFNTRGWKAGKYYIAVQTIDVNRLGSPWSEPLCIEIKEPTFTFTLSNHTAYTCDTLTLAMDVARPDGAKLHWELDGGKVIEATADSSKLKVMWNHTGTKNIALQVNLADGRNFHHTHALDMKAGRFIPSYDYKPVAEGMADFDMDGLLDATTQGNGFMRCTGVNAFEKVASLLNLDLKLSESYGDYLFVDLNRDGLMDMVTDYSNKGPWFINQGNFKFNTAEGTEGTMTILNDNYDITICDFNHDGEWDAYNGKPKWEGLPVYINRGSAETFEKQYMAFNIDGSRYHVYSTDLDRDGWMDFICRKVKNHSLPVYYGYGSSHPTLDSIRVEIPELENKEAILLDANKDGFTDMLFPKNEYTFFLAFNDSNRTVRRGVDIKTEVRIDYQCTNILDVDNNGCPDIMQEGNIIYLYSDGTYKAEKVGGIWAYNLDYIRDRNADGTPDPNRVFNLSNITNTRPEAPQQLRISQTADEVVMEWDDAQDAETPWNLMRYNISVKKKGAKGDGAYFISPLNGMNDKAAIAPGRVYTTATRYTIPNTNIPAGDYEFAVQAIDGWNKPSPFSQVITFSVEATPSMVVPDFACVGKPVKLTYTGQGTPAFDWDGGEITATEGKNYHITWSTPGTKNVTCTVEGKTLTRPVCVMEEISAAFSMPGVTQANMPFSVQLPADCKNNSKVQALWEMAEAGKDKFTAVQPVAATDSTISLKVEQNGQYILRLTLSGPGQKAVHEQAFRVTEQIVPEISIIRTDDNAHNTIHWDPKEWNVVDELLQSVKRVIIYKETNVYGQFRVLGYANPADGSYTDLTSSARTQASTYCIALETEAGESPQSKAHTSVHTCINRGIGSGWNLIWTPYRGCDIARYRIWRGRTPEQMELLTSLSGRLQSYSDPDAPEGEWVYAVEYIKAEGPQTMNTRAALTGGRATTISTAEGTDLIAAKEMWFNTDAESKQLSLEQPTLQLYVQVAPVNATYQNVQWQIVKGEDIATITGTGKLVATGKSGEVTVRATTIDGSNLTMEQTFQADFACTVKFDSQGGSPVDDRTVDFGQPVERPIDPVRQDLNFMGWFTDAQCTQPWNFQKDVVTQRITTLYAKWDDGSAVNDPEQNIASITATQGHIVLKGLTPGMPLWIVNVAGQEILQDRAEQREMQIKVTPGIYIVRCGKQSAKISVK